MRHRSLVAVAMFPLYLVGCASSGPNLPKYVEPTLPADRVVTIEGKSGTYVTVVDNAECKEPFIKLASLGGNTVHLAPGKHRLTVVNRPSEGAKFNFYAYPAAIRSDASTSIEQSFLPGHNYTVELDNQWNVKNNKFRLTDTTTGISIMQ